MTTLPISQRRLQTSDVEYSGTEANPSFVFGPNASGEICYNIAMFSPNATKFTPAIYTPGPSGRLLMAGDSDTGRNLSGQEIDIMDAAYGLGGQLVSR